MVMTGTQVGERILWVAHDSAPTCVSRTPLANVRQTKKGGYMKSKLFITLICSMLIVPLVSAQPKVKFGGLFYVYSFFWMNRDFDSDTEDGDQHFYMHGDIYAHADFGKGVSAKVAVGDWGPFGRHPITYEGSEGEDEWGGGHLLEAYITAANLFETPIGMQVGKQHVLYGDGMVAFDGGEDGITGLKLFYTAPMFNLDLFHYRLIEGGGTWAIGPSTDTIPDDLDLFGGYATITLAEGNVGISPYFFYRTNSWTYEDDNVYSENPMWLGARAEVTPVGGLHVKGEFAMMSGTCEDMADTSDYKGMAYMGELNYSLEEMNVPLSLGGAYLSFSGDDYDTDDENELYETAINGGYTFGFYKGWPGFGPAHLMLTGAGFACCAPWERFQTNLNVINGHVQYAADPIALRLDFFNYARNWVPDGVESALGNEIAVYFTYNYMDVLTLGATGGYFIPGEHLGEDLDAMIGGYVYMAKGF